MESLDRRKFRRNAYRVLLTRARQGIVIYIPAGDAQDPTRNPPEFEATAAFLKQCGAREINEKRGPISITQSNDRPTLF